MPAGRRPGTIKKVQKNLFVDPNISSMADDISKSHNITQSKLYELFVKTGGRPVDTILNLQSENALLENQINGHEADLTFIVSEYERKNRQLQKEIEENQHAIEYIKQSYQGRIELLEQKIQFNDVQIELLTEKYTPEETIRLDDEIQDPGRAETQQDNRTLDEMILDEQTPEDAIKLYEGSGTGTPGTVLNELILMNRRGNDLSLENVMNLKHMMERINWSKLNSGRYRRGLEIIQNELAITQNQRNELLRIIADRGGNIDGV